MKRHAALTGLSHDHHAALFVALRLRRASDATAGEVREAFHAYWDQHGRRHFREEEEILFPAYAAFGSAHHPLLARALGDHVAIRRLARAAREDEAVQVLVELGVALEGHVRLEERELFPLIEAALPEAELERVGAALAAAEGAGGG